MIIERYCKWKLSFHWLNETIYNKLNKSPDIKQKSMIEESLTYYLMLTSVSIPVTFFWLFWLWMGYQLFINNWFDLFDWQQYKLVLFFLLNFAFHSIYCFYLYLSLYIYISRIVYYVFGGSNHISIHTTIMQ